MTHFVAPGALRRLPFIAARNRASRTINNAGKTGVLVVWFADAIAPSLAAQAANARARAIALFPAPRMTTLTPFVRRQCHAVHMTVDFRNFPPEVRWIWMTPRMVFASCCC